MTAGPEQGRATSDATLAKPREDVASRRYLGGDSYAQRNPSWDIEDSPWKAVLVLRMLNAHQLSPRDIVEVGCGAGGVLADLARALPQAHLRGFDIAPDATRFWSQHTLPNLEFELGDFLVADDRHHELLLILDVVEHVADPYAFLVGLRDRSDYHIFHFPLDLSAASVLRGAPLLYVRNKVGHLHYYTKDLVLALLAESGYAIVDWSYTGAAFAAPQRTWKTRLASLPRRLAYALGKDLGVRLLGGETLMVLTRAGDR